VIETLRFELRSGADEGAFLAADKRLQSAFAYHQSGLLRRTTARGEDSGWLVVSLWDSPASADAGDPLRADHEACRAFVSFIDRATLRSDRYQELD
jgi:hypothetical protein